MPRLGDFTVGSADAALPRYDRSMVRTGIVHLGLGAFARAHLAVYVDDLIALGSDDLGITGVSLRHDDVPLALDPQDGLYTLGIVDDATMTPRVIGSVRRVLHAPSQAAEVRAVLASPDTSLVTVTVTEKGYCADLPTRRLDGEHPDVVHDLAFADSPRSVLGHLLLTALDRRATGAGDITVLSLDNIPANGTTLRALLVEMARASSDPTLADWIDEHVAFPCSMVDRMVPATDDAFRATMSAAIGLDDAWPVRAEPYSQWVVEATWATAIPPLVEVGVQVVDDVAAWEALKLRVLNGLHTTAALYGLRHGLDTVDQVVADTGGRRLLERVASEIAEVVDAPAGVVVTEYATTTLARFANSGLGHRCTQVATDTSQKLPQRILATVRDRIDRGLPIDALADVLALWAWSTLGVDHRGDQRSVDDPLAGTFEHLAADHGHDPVMLASALVDLEAIFGGLTGSPRLVQHLIDRLGPLLDRRAVLHVPAREVPIPTSVSAEAQAVLAARLPSLPEPRPALDDLDAWRADATAHDRRILDMIGTAADDLPATFERLEFGAARGHLVVADGVDPAERRTVLEIHGGGFVHLGGELCRILAVPVAQRFGVPVWAVDYRMPPDHPYPTPLDDCLAAYRALLAVRRPEEIVIVGGSAGGNLAAAMILRARDEGLPLPAAAVLRTPLVDLTDSGDSLNTNRGLDNILPAAEPIVNRLYAGGHDLTDPYVSPLFGDFGGGFPPTLLTTGTRDLFLSNTVRMHRALRAAGVPAELHVLEAAGHGGFLGQAPEDHALDDEVRRFATAHWARPVDD